MSGRGVSFPRSLNYLVTLSELPRAQSPPLNPVLGMPRKTAEEMRLTSRSPEFLTERGLWQVAWNLCLELEPWLMPGFGWIILPSVVGTHNMVELKQVQADPTQRNAMPFRHGDVDDSERVSFPPHKSSPKHLLEEVAFHNSRPGLGSLGSQLF